MPKHGTPGFTVAYVATLVIVGLLALAGHLGLSRLSAESVAAEHRAFVLAHERMLTLRIATAGLDLVVATHDGDRDTLRGDLEDLIREMTGLRAGIRGESANPALGHPVPSDIGEVNLRLAPEFEARMDRYVAAAARLAEAPEAEITPANPVFQEINAVKDELTAAISRAMSEEWNERVALNQDRIWLSRGFLAAMIATLAFAGLFIFRPMRRRIVEEYRAVRESEQRFRDIADAATDFFYEMDADLRYTAAWGKLSEIGLDPEKFVGKTRWEFAGADPERDEKWRRHREDLLARRPFRQFEYRTDRPDTGPRYFSVSGVPMFSESGAFLGYRGSATDVTELRHHEEALRAHKQLLESVMDGVLDGIVTADEAGIIQSFNPAAADVFGYSAEEVQGRNVSMLMPEPYRSEHDGHVQRYLRSGDAHIIGVRMRELAGQRKDGTTFPLELSVSETRLNGRRLFIGVMRDLTERKAAEAQLVQAQKMEAVGQLTGGVAHDFNNLLTVIIGNLELMSQSAETDARVWKQTQAALRAAQRGAELTRRLLAFARRQVLEPEVLNLNRLVSGMDDLLRRTLGETIEVRTVLEEALWPTKIDAHQLENTLLNLAINARDAMADGGKLIIETANTELDASYTARNADVLPGRYVLLAVTDTGAGMPPELVERAFEPFFTTKEFGKGTGLGLSQVYGFVKQSGGHAKIYSEPGHGTTVKLYFRRVASQVGEIGAAAATRESADEKAPTGNELILVVEDDSEVRETTVALVGELGYRALEAEDGPSALSMLEGNPGIALLFTDVVMRGGMTGIQLAEEVKRRFPAVKVLFASGYAESGVTAANSPGWAGQWLMKPYDRSRLAQKLRRVLDGR